MSALPEFIEVEPGRVKPLSACTREEVQAAASAYLMSALMGITDAVDHLEKYGGSPVSQDLVGTADETRAVAEALQKYADGM